MHKQLTRLALITSFGKGSDRPIRKTRLLILSCALGLVTAGTFTSQSLSNMVLATDLPRSMVLLICATLTFILTGFFILPVTHLIDSRQSILRRNLQLLPLSKSARWLVATLPFVIIACLLTAFFAPNLRALATSLSTNQIFIWAGYVFGLLAAIGFGLSNILKVEFVKYLGFVTICTGLLYGLEKIVKSPSANTQKLIGAAIVTTLLICCFGVAQRFFVSYVNKSDGRMLIGTYSWPSNLLKNIWFGIKTLRNKRSLGSFAFCFVLASSLAVANILKQENIVMGNSLITFGALLACCMACDVRGISRRYKTPEILSVKGINFFINSQIKSLLALNGLVVLPIVVNILALSGDSIYSSLLQLTSMAFAATAIGLMFSTAFVPENGEIGAQFMTAMSAIACLLLSPKIFKFGSLEPIAQAVAWLCLAGVCICVTLLIEDIRRKNYGHA